MAALTENIEVQEQDGVKLNAPVGVDIIYKGALCKYNSAGFIEPCAVEALSKFAGIAESEADNSGGSAGDETVDLKTKGRFLLTGTGFAQTDVAQLVYASDDQTVTKTEAANLQIVGYIVKFVSSTQVWVDLSVEGTVLGT